MSQRASLLPSGHGRKGAAASAAGSGADPGRSSDSGFGSDQGRSHAPDFGSDPGRGSGSASDPGSGSGRTACGPASRLHALDLLRGLNLISMIAYHGAYDLVYLYGVRIPGYRSLPAICGSRASAGSSSFCPGSASAWAALTAAGASGAAFCCLPAAC